jgi:hypothetical protein
MRSSARLVPLAIAVLFAFSAFAQSNNDAHRFHLKPPPRIVHGDPTAMSAAALSTTSTLPVWNYQVISSRDGNLYQGVIVGRNPENTGSNAAVNVTTQVVPIALRFESVATGVNLNTGIIATAPGTAFANPTAPQPNCLSGSNNVPLTLLEQSPIFRDAKFNFGGTDVGTTQYTDAFQRSNFWTEIDKSSYHVRLAPLQVMPTVFVKVPAASGLSLPANIFEPLFSMCGPEGLVDINFIDALVIKLLGKVPGINPGTFPMFMFYNTGMPIGNPRDLANCCAGGYHSINPAGPLSFQTYSPFDFDVSGFFVSSANDTAIVSHEAAEWMDDPYVVNNTPPWGNTGQVAGCQGNLEVGDPLTGSLAPRIFMPNGYTYSLQELADFSWFFGKPSLGIHGWFSDNGTFLTDAGPPCH